MAPQSPSFIPYAPRLTRLLRAQPRHPLASRRTAHTMVATSSARAPPSITDIASRHRKSESTVSETLDATLRRVTQINPHVNALLSVHVEALQARAAALDAALAAGDDPGPLAGVPIVVKDNICTAGHPTTGSSRVLDGFTPAYSATAVARLEAAGAIILGNANMDEFGMGSTTETSAYGATRNPLDLARVPGGSSGGSAAAVAASFAPAALGTDTGGSVRMPATFCGVSGIRPSYGRVSRHGLLAYASSFDVIGPIAHSVEDLALLLSIISGSDGHDATAITDDAQSFLPDQPPIGDKPLDGLRVGVVRESFSPMVESGVRDAVTAAVAQLELLGAVVKEVSLPNLDAAIAAYYTVAVSEASANLARYDGVRYGVRDEGASTSSAMYARTRAKGFGPEVRRRILAGTYTLSAGYYDAYFKRAMQIRRIISNDLTALFDDVDVLATPAACGTAYRVGEKIDNPVSMYLDDTLYAPSSLAGIPALSVPCGTVDGLPAGLQIMAPYMREDLALRVGHAYQAATTHHLDTFSAVDACLSAVE